MWRSADCCDGGPETRCCLLWLSFWGGGSPFSLSSLSLETLWGFLSPPPPLFNNPGSGLCQAWDQACIVSRCRWTLSGTEPPLVVPWCALTAERLHYVLLSWMSSRPLHRPYPAVFGAQAQTFTGRSFKEMLILGSKNFVFVRLPQFPPTHPPS